MGHPRPRPKRLAAKLLTIRQELGLSQPQIAQRLDIQEYKRLKYESDVNEPSFMIIGVTHS